MYMNICTCIYDINFRYTYIYIYTLEIFGKLKELTTCNLQLVQTLSTPGSLEN